MFKFDFDFDEEKILYAEVGLVAFFIVFSIIMIYFDLH